MGIFLSLTLSVVATGVLSDLWSKEWSTLRLSFQVIHHLFLWGLLLVLWAHCTLCHLCVFCFPHRPGDGAIPAPGRSDADDGAGLARGLASLSHEEPRCRAQQSFASTFLSLLSHIICQLEANGCGVSWLRASRLMEGWNEITGPTCELMWCLFQWGGA